MSPRRGSSELALSLSDVSKGLVSGVSERGARNINWLARADNFFGRPYRAKSVKPGSRDISTATLLSAPHSLMGFYAGGGNQLFVADDTSIYLAGTASYVAQSLPVGYPTGTDIWSHTNLNGALIAAQRNSGLPPLQYDGNWLELALPQAATTITFGANTGGGSVDDGTHHYRVRHRYTNGSSEAGSSFAAPAVTSPNSTVNITGGLNPASPRADYVGWTLERTKSNGTSNGPWWFVKDGNSGTTSDDSSDANLGYMADEGVHGQVPALDGVIGFANCLWGWKGSNLYFSNPIFNGLEGTGIANFDADNLIPVSKDDGDDIQLCVVVIDELLILKKHSVHVIQGIDADSFTLTSIVYADPSRGSEAGCGGPRAACVIGGKAYFWGEGGLFKYERGSVSPFGWLEAGVYVDDVNTAALDKILLVNHQGNYLVAWYPPGASTVANEQIVYDARLKQFWHWKGWAARDVIELKGGLFGGATQVICDPEADGSSEYHLWATFEGVYEKRNSDGSGGSPITVVEEWPWIDFGMPDDWKDLDYISIAAATDQPTTNVSIQTDPPGGDNAVSIPEKLGAGADWADAAAPSSTDLEWDVGDWAAASPTQAFTGVPAGTIGKRFKLTLTSTPDQQYQPTGIDLVAVLLPDREY